MGLNDTPSANRVHIGFFGRRNAGKSSVVNAFTAQNIAIVSSVLGTTTDPVYKSMELLPMGPVMIIDTPGIDDSGELGEMRVEKTRRVLAKTDVAVLVVDGEQGLSKADNELISLFKERDLPYIVAYNKSDLLKEVPSAKENEIYISAKKNIGINELKNKVSVMIDTDENEKMLVRDLIKENDFVVLVVPIDSAAPKGRLILPQQQMIRDLLEGGGVSLVCRETELAETLKNAGKKPKMVITDSQAFESVSKDTPEDILLTSFSILMARYKGFLHTAVKGAKAIDDLKDGDTVLISEGCTHHRQCDDIGTVKMPRWLREYTGKDIKFETSSGTGYPEDLSKYSLVIHCGGCMLNEKEVKYRMNYTLSQGVPFTNYGTAIAFMHNILKRSVECFPDIYKEL
ncbi:MAG: [FeFe] hydrogenase H-cluster maturation GTPase HydF [Acutalibacteraceae bacterium]